MPSEPRGKATGKHREFQVKVLGSQHRLPLVGCIVLARQLPHIPDDFKDQVNSLYKGFSSVKLLSHVQLFATLWTVACQAPLSLKFSKREYWSGLPFPSPGDLPDPGIEPGSPALQADSLPPELNVTSRFNKAWRLI